MKVGKWEGLVIVHTFTLWHFPTFAQAALVGGAPYYYPLPRSGEALLEAEIVGHVHVAVAIEVGGFAVGI